MTNVAHELTVDIPKKGIPKFKSSRNSSVQLTMDFHVPLQFIFKLKSLATCAALKSHLGEVCRDSVLSKFC